MPTSHTGRANGNFLFYVSGGCLHNPLLMKNIQQQPSASAFSICQRNINPDAKEAVPFAVLANETICGNAVNFCEGRNGIPNVSMGKIRFPD